ncbi:MAG: MBL fold metallo-hydrolase [Solirubrobacterales bacterium]
MSDSEPNFNPANTRLQEVADGLWAWVQTDGSWWINNCGLITDEQGDVLIDTCATDQRTQALLDAVAELRGGLDLGFALNTHAHGDHTYGNSLLPVQTTLIGHQQMREVLADDWVIENPPAVWTPIPDWGAVTKRLPTLTFTKSMALHLSGQTAEIIHPGHPAHTTGDCVAWVPEKRTLFAGDLLFHGLTPLAFTGSVEGARRTLDWIKSFDPEVVVPGHGPVIERGELDSVLGAHDRYYEFIADLGREAIAHGVGPLEIARGADLGEFAEWGDSERVVLNLHRFIADKQGREMDLMASFEDAIAYNGGPMITHVRPDEN